MNAYFCSKTGVRIVAPGVCKAVDPKDGHNEFSEQPVVAVKKPADKAPAKEAEKANEKEI